MGSLTLAGVVGAILEQIQENGSLCIAILALIVALLHGFATRQHNRLSVRPSLRLDRSRMLSESAGVELVNAGIGPAIIQRIRVQVLGEEIDGTRADWGSRVADVLELRKHVPRAFGLSAYSMEQGDVLAAHEKVALVSFSDADSAGIDAQELHLLYSSVVAWLEFEIRYTSMYGEKFACKTRGYRELQACS